MSHRVRDTIFALSSGSPPAAVGVVRVSGPRAPAALEAIAGRIPEPRRAILATLRDPETSQVIDKSLILYFPEPRSETGDDLAEFHIHGGRAVGNALLDALARIDGLRAATPGEFTRRAFDNGKLDLTAVEGLTDLLLAETETQRRAAMALAGGMLTRAVEDWQRRLLDLAAGLEAVLDFSDEGEVGEGLPAGWRDSLTRLIAEFDEALDRPPAERLRDGIRVVIAGPPNAGKSSLLNALSGREAAITSPVPGTTRDVVEAPTAIGGTPFLLIDTAGLRDSSDEVEAIGVALAQARVADADILLWLGPPGDCPDRGRAIVAQSKIDLIASDQRSSEVDVHVSPVSGEGMKALVDLLAARTRGLLPREGEIALNARHRALLAECRDRLFEASLARDLIIVSEALRAARSALDRLTGRAGVEDMLDTLFGKLCIGK